MHWEQLSRRCAALFIIAVVLLLTALLIEASDSSTIAIGANSNITAFSTCKKVTNNSSTGLTVYVPTVSSAEWTSFYNNPPSGVTTASCSTPITIPSSPTTQSNVNLCTLAGNPSTPGDYVFTIPAGVTINSTSASQPALTTGTCWVAGSTITLINNGNIYGKGGDGGKGGDWVQNVVSGVAGGIGGTAINLSYPATIDNTATGKIFGGGGGGGGGSASQIIHTTNGGSGGGGGQGDQGSAGGAAGLATFSNGNGRVGTGGNVSAPGVGGAPNAVGYGKGGDGGAWGSAGQVGSTLNADAPGGGGAAGKAVQLNGNAVTWTAGNNGTQVKGAVQ